MKTLVTGAAGFIGAHLCQHLLNDGHHVHAVDRRPIPPRPGQTTTTADILDTPDLLDAADVVYHLAGQPGVRQSWQDFDTYLRDNLAVTQRLLDAARATRPRRFVFASSSSVYGDGNGPVSPYGVTKLAVEALCNAYQTTHDVPVIGLRYFTVYGPHQRPDMAFSRFITAAKTHRPIEVYGDGHQTRCFTYVTDAVRATIAATRAEPGVYDIAGAGRASVLEAINIISELVGQPTNIVHLNPAAGDPRHTQPAGQALPGYTPRTPLVAGLAAQVAEA